MIWFLMGESVLFAVLIGLALTPETTLPWIAPVEEPPPAMPPMMFEIPPPPPLALPEMIPMPYLESPEPVWEPPTILPMEPIAREPMPMATLMPEAPPEWEAPPAPIDCASAPPDTASFASWNEACGAICESTPEPRETDDDVSPIPAPSPADIDAITSLLAADPAVAPALKAGRAGVGSDLLWPGPFIPYEFLEYEGTDEAGKARWARMKEKVRAAVTVWNGQFPHLRWVERTETPTWAFEMTNEAREAFRATPWGIVMHHQARAGILGSSSVGYRTRTSFRNSKRAQPLTLNSELVDSPAMPPSILHEMGHAAGLHHSHVNSERDKDILLLPECIANGGANDFQIPRAPVIPIARVDFDSLMIYGSTAGLDATKLTNPDRPWNAPMRQAGCFATMLKADGTGAMRWQVQPDGRKKPVLFSKAANVGFSRGDVTAILGAYPATKPLVRFFEAPGAGATPTLLWGDWNAADAKCKERFGFRLFTEAELRNDGVQRLLKALVPPTGGVGRCVWASDAPKPGDYRLFDLDRSEMQSAAGTRRCVHACTLLTLAL